jgi:hypothetical protein
VSHRLGMQSELINRKEIDDGVYPGDRRKVDQIMVAYRFTDDYAEAISGVPPQRRRQARTGTE